MLDQFLEQGSTACVPLLLAYERMFTIFKRQYLHPYKYEFSSKCWKIPDSRSSNILTPEPTPNTSNVTILIKYVNTHPIKPQF